jgi:hypothetical protein
MKLPFAIPRVHDPNPTKHLQAVGITSACTWRRDWYLHSPQDTGTEPRNPRNDLNDMVVYEDWSSLLDGEIFIHLNLYHASNDITGSF